MNNDVGIKNKKVEHLDYIKWMKFILRRSDEVGKIETPISAVIIDENGTIESVITKVKPKEHSTQILG